ncbi:MAG: PPC domain-containing protein, partial [Acidobacteria bacterium]|nr:PPC domain-containing protein [Acidobacteriota bacterium]
MMKNFRFTHVLLTLSLTVGMLMPWSVENRAGTDTKSAETVALNQGGNQVLRVDDDSFEQVIGYPDGTSTAYFLNRLTPPSYPATLQNVQIFFGDRANGLPVNHPITVLVGTNPSGSSNIDGISFQRFSSFVGFLDVFNEYDVSAVTINSGDFVVGYVTNNPPNIFPMDQDTTPPSRMRSYTSTNGSSFRIIDTFGSNLAGNFAIRASVSLGGPSGCNPQTVSCPGSTSGSLSSGDCMQGRRGSSFFTDVYQFNGTAGQMVTIDLTSSAFDTYLYLLSPSGSVVAEDDDSGGETNSRITFTLTTSGLWRIEVTSFSEGETGSYSLALAGCGGGGGGGTLCGSLLDERGSPRGALQAFHVGVLGLGFAAVRPSFVG